MQLINIDNKNRYKCISSFFVGFIISSSSSSNYCCCLVQGCGWFDVPEILHG